MERWPQARVRRPEPVPALPAAVPAHPPVPALGAGVREAVPQGARRVDVAQPGASPPLQALHVPLGGRPDRRAHVRVATLRQTVRLSRVGVRPGRDPGVARRRPDVVLRGV